MKEVAEGAGVDGCVASGRVTCPEAARDGVCFAAVPLDENEDARGAGDSLVDGVGVPLGWGVAVEETDV